MNVRLRELSRYSPAHDAEVRRLSAIAGGQEWWIEIPEAEGRHMRDRRTAAIVALENAIKAGQPAGEVTA